MVVVVVVVVEEVVVVVVVVHSKKKGCKKGCKIRVCTLYIKMNPIEVKGVQKRVQYKILHPSHKNEP